MRKRISFGGLASVTLLALLTLLTITPGTSFAAPAQEAWEENPADAAATRDHDGTTIHFCSTHCAAAFDTDPHRYAHGPSGAGHH